MTLSLHRVAASAVAATLLALGLPVLGGVAHASHNVVEVNPKGSVNNVTTTIQVLGSGFSPSPTTSVQLRRSAAPGDVIVGEVQTLASNSNTLFVQFNFTHMNPGLYDVVVAQNDPVVATEDVLPNAFTLTASGSPTVTSVTGRGTTGDITIRGTNFTRGSIVEFWVGGVRDTAMTFVRDGGTQDLTTINGHYSYTGGVMYGPHTVRVTHTDNSSFGQCVNCFTQPRVDSVSPASLGQGATNRTVLVNGTGFTGSTASISGSGVTIVSQAVLNDGQISMQVNVSPTATTGQRAVTVTHLSGGYHQLANALLVTGRPTLTGVSPDTLGQGAQNRTLTLSGSGFQAGMTVAFSPPNGITVGAVTVASSISATVVVSIAENAGTGARDVTVSNTDFGSATLDDGLTIVTGPKVTKVNPSSGLPNTTPTVTIEGSGFHWAVGPDPISVDFGPGITVTSVDVDPSGNLMTVSLNISNGAAGGLRNVKVTNTDDLGTGTCFGCFGIDNITVIGSNAGQNNATRTITINKTAGGWDGSSEVSLIRNGTVNGQGPIPGNVTSVTSTSITFTANLDHQAPGSYNIQVVTGPTVDGCTQCYTITGGVPTITAASPSGAGRGAQNLLVTLTGTNFANGDTVELTRAGVPDANLQVVPGSVTAHSLTSLSFRVNIAQGAQTGAVRIRVIDTTPVTPLSGFCDVCFTIVDPPTITSVSPNARGQNSDPVNVTITGQNFESGATVDFGEGINEGSVTVNDGGFNPDTITVTVDVQPGAETGPRNVVVTNTNGGSVTCTACFVVNAAPVITSISPSVGSPNDFVDVTINGTGFTNSMTIDAGSDVTESNFAFVSPTQVTVRFSIAPNAALGTRDVSARNNGDGGQGSGVDVFRVIRTPDAPTSVTATAGNQSATVSWTAPASNGGDPVSGYEVTCSPSCGTKTIDGDTTALVVTGLTNGTVYRFQVRAVNAAGRSLPSAFSNSVLPMGPDGDFVPLDPARIIDTRRPVSEFPGQPVGSPVGPVGTITVQVAGKGGVPMFGVTAVVANVTAVTPTHGGNLRVFPTGTTKPNSSTLNFGTRQTVPNLVKAKLGTNGRIDVHNASAGSTHVLVDVVGYFVDGTDDPEQKFTSLSPERLFDTRNGSAPDTPLLGVSNGPKASQTFTVADGTPVPANATAIVLNVTVVSPAASGFLTVYPAGQSRPTVSNLNFARGQTVPNLVVVKLGTGGDQGKITIFNGSAGQSNVLGDVVGYFASSGSKFKPLNPVRILDTRTPPTPLVGVVSRPLTVLGAGGVPNSSAVKAVVVNVTVVQPTAGGFLTVYPSGEPRPGASNLNFVRGSVVANLVVVKVGADGKIAFFNGSAGSTHVLADVVGYYL